MILQTNDLASQQIFCPESKKNKPHQRWRASDKPARHLKQLAERPLSMPIPAASVSFHTDKLKKDGSRRLVRYERRYAFLALFAVYVLEHLNFATMSVCQFVSNTCIISYPTYKKIASDLNLSTQEVYRLVRQGKKLGWWEIEERKELTSNGKWRSASAILRVKEQLLSDCSMSQLDIERAIKSSTKSIFKRHENFGQKFSKDTLEFLKNGLKKKYARRLQNRIAKQRTTQQATQHASASASNYNAAFAHRKDIASPHLAKLKKIVGASSQRRERSVSHAAAVSKDATHISLLLKRLRAPPD